MHSPSELDLLWMSSECLLSAKTDRQNALDRLQHRKEQSKQRRLQKGKKATLKQVMRARWSSLKWIRSLQKSNHSDVNI